MTAPPRICLVEDDAIMGESLCDRFALEGIAHDWHRDAGSALDAISRQAYALVISDYRLPDMSGEELFERLLKSRRWLPPFIFITGYGSIDKAVHLLKLGAADYLTKPFDLDRLVDKVHALCAAAPAVPASGLAPLGVSPAMRRIEEALPRLAAHARSLLVTGESGVGKEHVAMEFHRLAHPGREAPFVAVNCGAIPETLMEPELFGHEKGAFTGAVRQKKGVFEQAHGGTLFLDEIGEMPLAMQVKVLRALQERRIQRVGGEAMVQVDLALVCATHRDLKEMVQSGAFREDLFYRINVIQLRIPPLRERREDILWFARQFVAECDANHGGGQHVLSAAAENALLQYPWPGNLRELRHSLERACILSPGRTITPEAIFEEAPAAPGARGEDTPVRLDAYLRDCERRYIRGALEQEQGQVANTAARLGISRKNLWEKMKKLAIEAPDGGIG
ncbi:MAG TPA: sigma-54 dependent transcriptional regulator [Burkholderiales bacterium]|nr:sigma-54 dependent transcriptional regulator [Burkholderiales bacterium]